MNVSLVYVFPTVGQYAHFGYEYAKRFVKAFNDFPPDFNHTLFVISNGSKVNNEQRQIFGSVPCVFLEGDNRGWDIGAYLDLSESLDPRSMMVCFGSSSYFRRRGWLNRMVEAFQQYGPQLYGSLASYDFRPHIRTIGFWCEPELLQTYPHEVVHESQRYAFEHGEYSLTEWALSRGKRTLLVTWDGVWDKDYWMNAPNSYRKGDQSNCLVFDNRTDNHEGK